MRFRTTILGALVTLLAAALAVGQSKPAAPAKKAPAKSALGNAKRGKLLYDDYCGICHFTANREKKIGPGLQGIYKRGKFADGKKVDDVTMREWIIKGGKDMPAFEDAITKEQIDELIAYLKTI